MIKKCKECLFDKPLFDFYTHPQGVLGTLPRCKECIKKGRKTERERALARVNDKNRSTNPNRIVQNNANRINFRAKYPEKWNAHKLVNNFIKKNRDLKPTYCYSCGAEGLIHLHHFDYSKPNEVIPCCPMCHSSLHKGLEYNPNWIIALPF